MPNEHADSIQIARKYMDSLVIEGRVLGSIHPSSRVRILGTEFETPVMTAALSHLKDGMKIYAEGAAMAGAFCSIGIGSVEEMKEVASAGGRIMKVIKPYADREEIFSRIRCAEENGYFAVGMDVEHATNSDDDEDSFVAGFQMKQPTLEELQEYVSCTRLPFFFKGALSVQDALTAKKLGAAGVILGHHNSLMKWAIPPVKLLPDIRKAVGDDFILIADGGIEDGFDAFKALARGADLISVGKPLMAAYMQNGAQCVADTIGTFTKQLKAMLLRTGSPDPAHIDPSVVHEAYWLK